MTCPVCSTHNALSARFCVECGAALALSCPACGAAHAPGQKFCAECGTPLAAGGAPPGGAPAQGRGELRLVSVLFVDLVGYTALSESRDPEDVRDLLGRYFETARTIVGRYGGTIEKFIGDAIMAVWGVPAAREDDAERAVRAGLELVAEVEVFAADVGAPALRARAGVVTGQAAAMVAPGEGLVVGDRVNTAARVQSVAPPGAILVDEVTRQASSSAITYVDAGEHSVKGKAEPLQLWRAERVVAGLSGTRRTDGLEAPFVGRESELRLVKELFHAGAERGAARLVAVSGSAGSGKTRLRWEFEKYVDGIADEVYWQLGRCPSYGEGVAYSALAEMVRQRLSIAEDDPPAEAERKLADGVRERIADPGEREYVAARLGALLGVADPGLGREELFAGWRLFFEHMAAEKPVILAFEDLQWADAGLLDFIEHVLDWSSRHRILLLTFARPELADRREAWGAGRRGATPIYLEPLGDVAMGRLLDGLVAGLPAEARDRIVGQAEGVPLYALETVRALADRGVLAERDGRLELVGELGRLDVPASLSSLLASRLDGLEPDEREVVKAMSVFGGSFPRAAAAALVDVAPDRLDELLASLVRKEVLAVRADPLSPDRGHYGFAQTLLGTVARDMLAKRERKPLHLAAARYLRAAFADDGEEVSEVVATHYLEAYRAAPSDPDAGELRAEALAALRRAGRRAGMVGAPEAAERAYRRAVDLAAQERERTELTQAAAGAALRAGRYAAALELFEEAVAAHAAAGRERDAARLARDVGQAMRGVGRLDEAIERMRAALHVLDPSGLDADAASLSAELGRVLVMAGRGEEAAGPLDDALRIAEALELPDVLCHAMTSKGVLYVYLSRVNEAGALLDAARAIAERNGLTPEQARAEGNSGDVHLRYDQPGATERCEAAMALARRLGDRPMESVSAGNLMLLHLLQGRWDELRALAAELLEGTSMQRAGAEFIQERLVALHAYTGDVPGAHAALKAMSLWEASGEEEQRSGYASAAGAVALAEGRPEAALALTAQAVRDAVGTGASHVGGATETVRLALPVAMDAALRLGRLDEAGDLHALVSGLPRGHVPPFVRAELARSGALLAAARGEHELVERDLRDAVDAFAALAYPYWRARAEVDLAAWLVARDRRDEAAAAIAPAMATLDALGAAPALAEAHALLAPRPPAVAV